MRVSFFSVSLKCLFWCILLCNLSSVSANETGDTHRLAIKRFKVINKDYVLGGKRFSKIYDEKLKRERIVNGSVIIKFKDNVVPADIEYYLERKNLKAISDLGKSTYLCEMRNYNNKRFMRFANKTNGQDLSQASEDYEYDEHELSELVESFDLNEFKKVKTTDLMSEPYGKKQWHLKNTGKNGLLPGADINAERAWDFSRGEGIKVAVIDTGFDTGHNDINYYKQGYNALSFNGDFHTISDVGAVKLVDAEAPRDSFENHGTAVAGIIAAKDNSSGVIGVAPEAQIIPIRLIDDQGQVSSAQIISAFRVADALGAKIINNSWGSVDPNLKDGEINNISEAEKATYKDIALNGNNGKGVVVIFASGNSGHANFNNAPEARIAEVMAVGATDSTDQRVSYSVFGPELDIVAPGGGYKPIYTTDRRDLKKKKNGKTKRKVKGYSKGKIAKGFRGTSAAAPVVAGVAALVWSVNPNLSADEVKEILYDSAIKIQNPKYKYVDGKDVHMGHGRVDAWEAVKLALESYN